MTNLAIAVLLLPLSGAAQNNSGSGQPSGNTSNHSSDVTRQTVSAGSDAGAGSANNKQNNPKQDTDSTLYTVYLVCGVIIALMTITSSVVIYRQFVSLKKIERAWVTVDVKWADTPRVMDGVSSDAGFQDLRHASSIYVRLFIHNGGNTPAWLVAKRIGFTILDEMPKLPNFDKLPPEDSLGGVPLSRGEKKNSIMWLSCDAVYSRKKAAFIYGYVKYTDIFGDIRTTSFGFAVNGGADLKRLNVPGFNITT